MDLFKLLLSVTLLTTIHTTQAQIKAVTETGEEVLLSSDGTWKYVEDVKNNDSLSTNPALFKKSATANFLLKSKNTAVGFWLDSKKWNFAKSTDEASEYSFSLKGNGSVGGLVVTEDLGMDLKSLRKIAIGNMQKVSSKFKIIREEKRTVNDLTLLMVQIDAVVEGIKINYITYYFTNAESTVQFITYIPKNAVEKYFSASEELLNGLVTLSAKEAVADALPNSGPIQSSLAANSNCRTLFTGSWSYAANGKKYINRVAGNKMYETSEDKRFHTEYSITWLNTCVYELRLLHSTDPVSKLIKAGSPITVEVLNIDSTKMSFSLSYGGSQMQGEMTKVN
jgi:hypothetical protein